MWQADRDEDGSLLLGKSDNETPAVMLWGPDGEGMGRVAMIYDGETEIGMSFSLAVAIIEKAPDLFTLARRLISCDENADSSLFGLAESARKIVGQIEEGEING